MECNLGREDLLGKRGCEEVWEEGVQGLYCFAELKCPFIWWVLVTMTISWT